jgi:hypothetical protein
MSAQTVSGPAPRERGIGYALVGALGITLVAIILGGVLFAWLISAARGPSAPQLLSADTQFYAALPPNVGGVVDVNQLQDALRQGFGVPDPASLVTPLERLIGASVNNDVATWLGSEIVVAVRDVQAGDLQTAESAQALLRDGEVLFFFASKNDPQAETFLAKHRASREELGATFSATTVDEVTIYAQEGGAPSPIAAFALLDHYVIFSNSPAAIEALATADPQSGAGLAELPAFAASQDHGEHGLPINVYTDGSGSAELIRAALRQLITGLAGS